MPFHPLDQLAGRRGASRGGYAGNAGLAQVSVLVAGCGRVPRMTGPAGEAGADGEGARVLRP